MVDIVTVLAIAAAALGATALVWLHWLHATVRTLAQSHNATVDAVDDLSERIEARESTPRTIGYSTGGREE